MTLLDTNRLPRTARLRIETIDSPAQPGALAERLFDADDPVFLDSSALDHQLGRYSLVTCCPLEVLSLRDGRLVLRNGTILADDPESLWSALAKTLASVPLTERPAERPALLPGWFGFLGYELGRYIERLPGRARRDTPLPDLRLGFYDAVAVYDALDQRWQLLELTFDDPPAEAGAAGAVLRRLLAETPPGDGDAPQPTEHADATAGPLPAGAISNFTPDAYRQAVARCIDYIAAGDIFQVNLSQRITVPHAPAPGAIYRTLRRRNPAWYAAYLGFVEQGQRCAVLSSSPELFLAVRDGAVLTRPIKGTRPRIGQTLADQRAAAELLASEKDNAELAMIVDLLRNDLGRACKVGSIRVAEARRLETHPTVLHLVASVVGRLRPEVGPAELIRATFPGGSITGAPKIRAMEIIDELEPHARGVYTGCIGTVAVDGDAVWNIAIRTMVHTGQAVHVQVGGGIVADSTPEGEYQETLDKARAMLEAVAAARPD